MLDLTHFEMNPEKILAKMSISNLKNSKFFCEENT